MKSNGKSTFDLNISNIIKMQNKFELFTDRANLDLSEKYFIRSVQCFIQKIFKFKVNVLFVFMKLLRYPKRALFR